MSSTDLLVELHGEHARALWGFALRLTGGDHARAEDVVQETLLRAWRSRDVLAAQPPEPVPDADAADRVLESWLVADALRRLSLEHRQVVLLCYFGGRSVAEAAQELGIPPGTVKSRTHYALRSLRLVLEEMGVTR